MADSTPSMQDHLIPQIAEAITEGYTELSRKQSRRDHNAETLNCQVRDLNKELVEVKASVNRMWVSVMGLKTKLNFMHADIQRIVEIAEQSRDAQELLEPEGESYTPSSQIAEQSREVTGSKRARRGD